MPPSRLLSFGSLLLAASALAAPIRPFDRDAVRRLAAADATHRAAIGLHPATGAVRFVRVPGGALVATPAGIPNGDELARAGQARDFLDRHGKAFGLTDPERELRAVAPRPDPLGGTHLAYEQVHRGVPVFAGHLLLHFDADGNLYAANGTVVPTPRVDTRPRLDAARAATRAVELLTAELGSGRGRNLRAGASRLLIWRDGLLQGLPGGRDHLVWEVEVHNRRVRELAYVDAHTGKLVDRISRIHEVLTRRVYNGGASEAELVWEEGDPLPYGGGPSPAVDAGVNEIIDFTADAYALFLNLSAGTYPSWDGQSAPMRGVYAAPQLDCPNASWNGATTNYCEGLTTDDVVAHEWTHAYTQTTHGLIYRWQPGALNEAYSDIFGEVADQLNATGDGDDATTVLRAAGGCTQRGGGGSDPSTRWLVGERQSGFVIRDMWSPNCEGDPGRVSDSRYSCAPLDSGGVHTNSGVVNHLFALLVDGGSYNGQTVRALGATKAANLYWRAMTVYQVPASDFADHADALEQSCADLAAAGTNLPALDRLGPSGESVTAADCAEVADAIAAVELRQPPSQCSFRPLLAPNPPPPCESGNRIELVGNDFEGGFGNWARANRGVYAEYRPRDFELAAALPGNRPGTAAFGISSVAIGDCVPGSDDQSGAMTLDSPRFTVPSGNSPRLVFDHYVATEAEYDGGNLKLARNGGAFGVVPASAFRHNAYNDTLNDTNNTSPLAGQPAWTGTDGGSVTGSWGQTQVDFTGLLFPGDTAQLRFEHGVDGCNGVDGWYLDDVSLYQCGAGAGGPCRADGDTACLLGGRFAAEVAWVNQYDGRSGRGIVVPNSDLTTFFAFDDRSNVELILKVLDFGDVIKVFYGQLTDLQFTLTVRDTQTGAVRTYRNSEGNCGGVDDGAFAKSHLLAPATTGGASGNCIPGSDALCLLGHRFEIEVDWRNQFDGSSGNGVAQPLSDLTGLFTFTDPTNVELLTKVLDFGDRILFIYGALTNLEYVIRVTDTATGAVKSYLNPAGQFCGAIDPDAF